MAVLNSPSTGTAMEVDSTSQASRTTLYDTAGVAAVVPEESQAVNASGVVAFGKNDEMLLPLRLDRLGSQAVASFNPLLIETFENTTIHPIRWLSSATTMAASQSSVAGLTINSANITTVSTGYMLTSTKRFLKALRNPIQLKARARLNMVNNSVMELGFGEAASFNGAISTGAYWQVTPTGVLQPVVTYNSVDITGVDIRSLVNTTSYYTFDVFMDDDEATFVCQDTSTGLIINRQSIKLPLSAQSLLSSQSVAVLARVYNTGVAPAQAPNMYLTSIFVLDLDANKFRPWAHVMAAMDRGSTHQAFSGVQLAQWTNSAEPTSATLSNTAAGYTTLGGKFQFAAVAGAATDYALFAFTVPLPASLTITGVDIDAWNIGAAVATTATVLTWAISVGSTAVSLATATVGRIGLGAQAFPVGAAIGTVATRISKQFQTPLHCPGGRFVHIILKMPVGTATASQVIAGMVNIEGYFE